MSLLDGDRNAPWSKYSLEDKPGAKPDEVGVRNAETGELFTPAMAMALKNPNIMGPGLSGSQGAMILQANGSFVPN